MQHKRPEPAAPVAVEGQGPLLPGTHTRAGLQLPAVESERRKGRDLGVHAVLTLGGACSVCVMQLVKIN